MPRYRLPSGVVVQTGEDIAAQVDGVLIDDDAPDTTTPPPADLQAWLDAEQKFGDELQQWLDAETAYQGGSALTTADLTAGGRRGGSKSDQK